MMVAEKSSDVETSEESLISGSDKEKLGDEASPPVDEAPVKGMAAVLSKLLEKPTDEEDSAECQYFLQLNKKRKVTEREEVNADSGNQTIREANKTSKEPAKSKKRKVTEDRCRVKPTALDKERERLLSRIATRGVVQLFNAVNEHQNELDNKLTAVNSSERKKDKVMRSVTTGAFLDILKSTMLPESSAAGSKVGSQEQPNHQQQQATASEVSEARKKKTTKKRVKQQQVPLRELGSSDAGSEEEDRWEVTRDNYLVKPATRLRDWGRVDSDDG